MENLNKFLRKLLIKLLRLDEWHCSSHYDKEYARYTVKMINNLMERDGKTNGQIIEIGCGLGDSILHPDTKFRKGSFANIGNEEIYCLIMVNLLHFIDPDYTKGEIRKIIDNNKVEYIVLDELRNTENTSYQYECHGDEILGGQYVPCYRSKRMNAAEGANRHIIIYKKR